MTSSDPIQMSYGQALALGADRLVDVAGASARFEAEQLAAAAAGLSRARLLADLRAPMPDSERAAFEGGVARRAAGEPIAYVLRRAPFLDFDVRVDPAVLIPRPETELLAEWAIDHLRRRGAAGGGLRVLDIGTGSGVLAIAVARACPSAAIWATDVSPSALAVAAGNARALGVAVRVTFVRADLWPPAPAPAAFDLVVANLPYVGTGELAEVADDVLAWEPHGALFAGPDGLALLRRFAAGIGGRLAKGGAAGLEVGWRQAPAVAGLMAEALPGHAVSTRPDEAGIDRFVVAEPAAAR